MKKGRHRRFEEARALKRITLESSATPCDECGASAEAPCASWCLARVPEDDLDEPDDDRKVSNVGGIGDLADDEHDEFDSAPSKAANY